MWLFFRLSKEKREKKEYYGLLHGTYAVIEYVKFFLFLGHSPETVLDWF